MTIKNTIRNTRSVSADASERLAALREVKANLSVAGTDYPNPNRYVKKRRTGGVPIFVR